MHLNVKSKICKQLYMTADLWRCVNSNVLVFRLGGHSLDVHGRPVDQWHVPGPSGRQQGRRRSHDRQTHR